MIGDILRDVALLHEVTVREIRGQRRLSKHVAARHAAIWILRQVDETLSGSPDRWAIANARVYGVPFVKSA